MSRKNNLPAIDRALAQAEVLAGEYDDYDAQAALNRIAHRVVWRKAAALEHRARRARHSHSRPEDREAPSTAMAALHARAAAHLGSLSSRVVRDPAAIAAMALLVDDPARIEPAGALAFACLLYLADRHEAAQFWWQFAAGADSATAARCLYLHHLQLAEPDSALYWHHQAQALYDKETDPMLTERPTLLAPAPDLLITAGQLDVVVEVKRCTRQHRAYEARWWVFSTSLTDAVLRLETDSDEDFGAIPKPDPDLAAELEDATTS